MCTGPDLTVATKRYGIPVKDLFVSKKINECGHE